MLPLAPNGLGEQESEAHQRPEKNDKVQKVDDRQFPVSTGTDNPPGYAN